MKIKIIKEQKGLAGSDALIALLIIALFSGLIATISYNIFLSNSSIKRMSTATSYIVDVFEYVDKQNYEDVTEENIIDYFNKKYYYMEDGTTKKDSAEVKMKESQDEEITTPYEAEINIQKYSEMEGNEDKADLVEQVTMIVRYKLGNKEQVIEMKRIKSKENLNNENKTNIVSQ